MMDTVAKSMSWDESVDLLIVGSGAGAICAALVAKDNGLEPLIVEKLDKFGGSTGYSGGVVWIPNNPLMAREGVPDSHERAREYLDAVVTHRGPGTSPARREAFLRTGPELVSYLESKGMRWRRTEGYADYHVELPGGDARSRSLIAELFDINELREWKCRLSIFKGPVMRLGMDELNDLLLVKRTWKGKVRAVRVGLRMLWQSLSGKDVRGAGAALQGRMLQIGLRTGVRVWIETPMEELVVEHGRVVGAVIRRNGKQMRIQARRGVLLNSGGFAHDAGMRSRYSRMPMQLGWSAANPGDTGETMRAAMALGAATDCMDECWWVVTSRDPNGAYPEGAIAADGSPVQFGHHFDLSYPHVMLVDQQGNRFANEACSYMELGQRMYERHRLTGKAVPAWAIIESRHRERYVWGTVMGKTPQSWLDSGYMKQADTIEALAAQCGIDTAGLRRTVDRFNGFCKTGVDEEFNKGGRSFDRYHGDPTVHPNPNLGAIDKPPFYAVAIYPGELGTSGGLVTDENGRVLTAMGTAIEGLYATGNTTASVMGRSYPGAGATIAPSMVFAYRAALHSASQSLAQEPLRAAAG